jgi:NAD+ kinase
MSPRFKNLLVVIKQTAFEEYSQLKLRGLAPKALRWPRLEQRYNQHKSCVDNLIGCLKSRHSNVNFSCVNRVDLDRQHLYDVDLVVAVGGDGTVLSAGHFLDNGTIPLVGLNSDPTSVMLENNPLTKTDERRSHGALCYFTSHTIQQGLDEILSGGGRISERTRIQVTVKSTFSETKLVPALNDILISHPTPAAVSRFRMGWLNRIKDDPYDSILYNSAPVMDGTKMGGAGGDGGSDGGRSKGMIYEPGTLTRVNGETYEIKKSFNAWSSGMWVCTPTGSTAAMSAAGGSAMNTSSSNLQYLIREHLIEKRMAALVEDLGTGMVEDGEQLHLRWNSNTGRIFIDGAHLVHDLMLGDEIVINNRAPPLKLFVDEERGGG